ncbi:MAG: hypothetical protein AAFX95_07535 [Cyanobacteria bacterium J06639_16]
MDKALKRKIQRLWRDRMLMGAGTAVVLGFSVLQLQAVLKHRLQQPSWLLELVRPVEVITDKNGSAEEIKRARAEIQVIAQLRRLPVTASLVQALAKTQALAWALELDRALELDLELAKVQALALEQAQVLELAQALDLELAQAQALELELFQALELAQAQALELELFQALELAQALDLALDLALELDALQNDLLVVIVTVELEQTHGLTIQQGQTLEQLLSHEPNRARILLQSGVLLGVSSLVLVALLLALTRLRGVYLFPLTAQLIAFLPEECVAELGVLHRRMKQAKTSPWLICLRLLEEFVTLLWVFYIQVQLENLTLPPGDRKTDD